MTASREHGHHDINHPAKLGPYRTRLGTLGVAQVLLAKKGCNLATFTCIAVVAFAFLPRTPPLPALSRTQIAFALVASPAIVANAPALRVARACSVDTAPAGAVIDLLTARPVEALQAVAPVVHGIPTRRAVVKRRNILQNAVAAILAQVVSRSAVVVVTPPTIG